MEYRKMWNITIMYLWLLLSSLKTSRFSWRRWIWFKLLKEYAGANTLASSGSRLLPNSDRSRMNLGESDWREQWPLSLLIGILKVTGWSWRWKLLCWCCCCGVFLCVNLNEELESWNNINWRSVGPSGLKDDKAFACI